MGLSLGTALAHAVQRLDDAGIDTAHLDARLLLEYATGLSRAEVIGYPEAPLSAEHETNFSVYVERRAAHEPVSRITGMRAFWGLNLELNDHTLDPRPDSETLVAALLEARSDGAKGEPLSILDLGTGTGCLMLALLSEWPAAQGLGVDISASALQVARSNAQQHNLDDRATWQQSNWLEVLRGSFDIVVSNPPYIPSHDIAALAPEVRTYDPPAALDGGKDGLDFFRRTAEGLDRLLSPSGVAAFEVGEGQAMEVTQLFESQGFSVGIKHDLAGIARCVLVGRAEK